MPDPYKQAAMSYAHWARSWGASGYLLVGGMLVAGFLVAALFAAAQGMLMPALFFQIVVLIPVAIHVRDQFSYPRARLLPDFHKVHGVIACVGTAVVAVVLPATFAFAAGLSPVGFVAMAMLLFAAILWLVMLQLTWFSSLLCFLLCVEIRFIDAAARSLVSGQHQAGAVLLIALAAVMIVLAGCWLWHLTEESRGYRFATQTNGVSKTEEDYDGPGDSLHVPCLRVPASLRMIRHARRASVSRWSRVCRWQPEFAGWSISYQFLSVICAITAMESFRGRFDMFGLWSLCALMACIVPALRWPETYAVKAPAMSYELLLPVSRLVYLRQLGMAAALSQIELWGILNGALVLWWSFGLRTQISLPGVVSILVISALCQVWFFGITVLLSPPHIRRNPSAVLVFVVSLVPLLIAMAMLRPFTEWQIEAMAWFAILAFIGVLASKAAYRRWLLADFDW